MRRTAFATIRTARTSDEAADMLERLRRSGLHPADLALTAPLPLEGDERSFPIQVPLEEAAAARKILEMNHWAA